MTEVLKSMPQLAKFTDCSSAAPNLLTPVQAALVRHMDNRTLIRWARTGYVPSHPLGDVRKQADTRQYRRPKAVNDSILDALANEASTVRDRAVVNFLIDTGLRGGEIVRLDRAMITFDLDGNGGGGELFVDMSPTKRTFRFGHGTAQALQEYLRSERTEDRSEALLLGYSGNRLSVPQLSNVIRRLCAKLGINRISLRQFRVNYALRFVNGGGSLEALAKLLGHKSSAVTTQVFRTPTEFMNSEDCSRPMEAANTSLAVR